MKTKTYNKSYLKNKDLYNEIVLSLETKEPTNQLIKYFILMTNKISEKFQFKNYDDKKDSIQDALLLLLKNWKLFDPKYPNAFAYYTEIIKRSFVASHNSRTKIHLVDNLNF